MVQPVKRSFMGTRRVLWTTVPEKFSIRKPTGIFSAAAFPLLQHYYAISPHTKGMELWHFAPEGAFARQATSFQRPGEGPFRVIGRLPRPFPHWDDEPEGKEARSSVRVDNAVRCARHIASCMGTDAVVWELGAEACDGVLSIGAAHAHGRAVAVSAGPPSFMATMVARAWNVELEIVTDAQDQQKAARALERAGLA